MPFFSKVKVLIVWVFVWLMVLSLFLFFSSSKVFKSSLDFSSKVSVFKNWNTNYFW